MIPLKHFTILTSFIFAFNLLQAQTSEPTLRETLDWIKNKMSTYKTSCFECREYNEDGFFYSGEAEVNENNAVTKVCKTRENMFHDLITTTSTLSLYDVTSFIFDNYTVTLFSKEKKVRSSKVTPGKANERYNETTFTFELKFGDEADLKERFDKALRKLVYYNTKDKPKEAF